MNLAVSRCRLPPVLWHAAVTAAATKHNAFVTFDFDMRFSLALSRLMIGPWESISIGPTLELSGALLFSASVSSEVLGPYGASTALSLIGLNTATALRATVTTDFTHSNKNPNRNPEPKRKQAEKKVEQVIWGCSARHHILLAMRTVATDLFLPHRFLLLR